MKKFKDEYELAHPERIGETDRLFAVINYAEWLEEKLFEARQVSPLPPSVKEAALEAKKSANRSQIKSNHPYDWQSFHDGFLECAQWMQNQSGEKDKNR